MSDDAASESPKPDEVPKKDAPAGKLARRTDDLARADKPAVEANAAKDGKDAKADKPKPVPQEAPKGFVEYIKTRHDPLTSLVLTIPVFLLYHLGILLIDVRNGVDFVSEITLALLENKPAYIGVTLGLAALLVGVVWFLRRRGKLRPAKMPYVVLEGMLLAMVMAISIGWATGKVFASQVGPDNLSPLDKIILSAGAGFHEELVFRAGLFAGISWILLRWTRVKEWKKVQKFAVVAGVAVVSSLVFSAVHYVGAFGDDFTAASFFFRALTGVFLCVVYQFRGFAVAVYTHFLYDVFVFFM
jgi:hypothetical protein